MAWQHDVVVTTRVAMLKDTAMVPDWLAAAAPTDNACTSTATCAEAGPGPVHTMS